MSDKKQRIIEAVINGRIEAATATLKRLRQMQAQLAADIAAAETELAAAKDLADLYSNE